MTLVIKDYFLPEYIEKELGRNGDFKITRNPSSSEKITIDHLEVSVDVIRSVAGSLRRRNRELYRDIDLSDHDHTIERISGLSKMGRSLSSSSSPVREDILKVIPELTGYSEEMIIAMLGSMSDLLMSGEMKDGMSLPLNTACKGFIERGNGYIRYYKGSFPLCQMGVLSLFGFKNREITPIPFRGMPKLVTSIAAGNVPGISLMEALFSTMIGAASLGKNATAEPFLGPRMFEELEKIEIENGTFPVTDTIALFTFSGAEKVLLNEMIKQGDHVRATGGSESKKDIMKMIRRQRMTGIRGLKRNSSGHWHKVSFDIVGRDMIRGRIGEISAHGVAMDNSMFNTQGCLSCQQVMVEGDSSDIEHFIENLKGSMEKISEFLPKGKYGSEGLREMYLHYESRPVFSLYTNLSEIEKGGYVIVLDRKPMSFKIFNALNRCLVVRQFSSLKDVRSLLKDVDKDLLQSCAIAVEKKDIMGISNMLGDTGVNRIVPAGDIWNMVPGMDSWDGYLPPIDMVSNQWGYWTTINFKDPVEALKRTYERNIRLLAHCREMAMNT